MSAPITIKLRPEDEQLLRDLKNWPAQLPKRIARALDRQNDATVSYTQRTYLSFPKHGPTVLNGLRVISNRLRGSLRSSKAVIDATKITSAIGSNVKYAAVHEFGGTFNVKKSEGVVHLKTIGTGSSLARQDGYGNLAVFAGKKDRKGKLFTNSEGKVVGYATEKAGVVDKIHTRAVHYEGSTYSVTYPERMPVRRGIADQQGAYRLAVGNAVRFQGGGAA